jgi:hypothetical protein
MYIQTCTMDICLKIIFISIEFVDENFMEGLNIHFVSLTYLFVWQIIYCIDRNFATIYSFCFETLHA